MQESSPGAIDAESGADADVNPADSSPGEATSGDVEKTFVETVSAVLTDGEDSSPSGEDGAEKLSSEHKSSEDEAGSVGKEDTGDLPEEVSDEEIKDYSKGAQRRIQRLVDTRRERDETIASLRPKAEQMDKVTSFMEAHGIEPHEFDSAMNITRVINSGDFDQALKLVEPIYQELQQKAGNVLPNDLKERVDLGYISEEDARELHRNRVRTKTVEAQQQETREREQQERKQREWNDHAQSMQAHSDEWAKTKAVNDPDWHLKRDPLGREIELLIRRGGPEGYPKTREEVLSLCEDALKTVEEGLKQFRPKPEARVEPNGDHASPDTKSKPKSYEEAIDRALAG